MGFVSSDIFWLFFGIYLLPLWHDFYSFPFSFRSLELNPLKTPKTVSICIKLCKLYWAVWNYISYLVKSYISFRSDLSQSNSITNFTILSDSFCVSLIRSGTVKSNNWNLAWPELSCTNFYVENLELYKSHLLNDLFIALKEDCVLSRSVITSLTCDSILGFTIQNVRILVPLWTNKGPFLYVFQKIHDIGYNMDV